MINRLILWLSLAGMILALHLWIQKARGFDQGCLGLETHGAVIDETEGCGQVSALPASHLLGVSNAAWGYAFYFGLALLSFAKIVMPGRWPRRLHALGEIAVAGAFVYSGYLVYQMGFVAHAWCVLCSLSATLVAALFVLHVVLRRRGGFTAVDEALRGQELGLAAGALFGAMGVLVGVLLFVDRLGTRALDEGSTGRELEQIIGQTLPVYIDAEKLAEMRACHFDWQAPTLKPGALTDPSTPFIGNPAGPEVVVFYDPNCPHCKAYDRVFRQVIEKFKDRARFTMLPRPVWDASIPQTEALKVAEGSGKYFELWEAMFERQPGPRRGMDVGQITALFQELGIDPTNVAGRLAAARPAVLAARARAKAAGINAVPAVYIAGRKVWSPNRSPECMTTLIERMLAGAVKPVR